MDNDQLETSAETAINVMEKSETIPIAYTFNVQSPKHLIDLMTEEGVYLPMEITAHQMANIRFIILTRRLRQVPFHIVKMDDCWFIEQVFHSELGSYLKPGDRLLIVNKTMILDQFEAVDIFKLILYSPTPFLIWVTWDPDTFLKHQDISRQSTDEERYINAKAYLLQTRSYDEISLYEQLSLILANSLRSPDQDWKTTVAKFIEEECYPILSSDLRPVTVNEDLAMVKLQSQLLRGKSRDRLDADDYKVTAVPNMMDLAFFCSSAGYGLHNNEFILLWSAMKRLNDQIQCTEMKFWGKIFGLCCDYYIVQVQHDNEITQVEIDISRPSGDRKQKPRSKKLIEPLPTSSMDVPSEPNGVGTNQYTYFVTNSPGYSWIKLPDAKPKMIDDARKLRTFFTGCLSSPIRSSSVNLQLEQDYLRAQIARISATTHISPAGFYILSSNDGEEQIEEQNLTAEQQSPTIILNPEFNNDATNPITAETLANQDLQEWVHTQAEILLQGRTSFWRPTSANTFDLPSTEEMDHEDEYQRSDDSRNAMDSSEIPAPRLQPIGEDKSLHTDQPPWSVGLTMSIMHEYSLCYVRSNRWPGALTLGHGGDFYYFYIGWGQKYDRFNPAQPSLPELEYPQNFIEANDPSVEKEEAQRSVTAPSISGEYMSDTGEEDLTEEDIE